MYQISFSHLIKPIYIIDNSCFFLIEAVNALMLLYVASLCQVMILSTYLPGLFGCILINIVL